MPLLSLLTTAQPNFTSFTRRALFLAACALTTSSAYAQRELKDIPTPDPVAERAAMQIADGFDVNLFAADPMFSKPIHINFDDQGRLWVASSKNYPQLQPGAQPTDQIVVLEDTDGDGQADKHTVFADNLMIPTGVLPGDGGVYVANSIELIHLSDTDGDGKADRKRTVLSGFGTEDTHHLLHTLRYCPDGRIGMNQSIYIHSHIETPYGIKHLDGGGIWKFDAETSRLDVFCKGFVNPWGHVIDHWGQSFATDGAYGEGINYVFPGSVFFSSPGAERWLKGLNPGSPKHCGLEMVTGAGMPDEAQSWMITNDFRGHRVCVFDLQRQNDGSYRSVQLPELIRTSHVAFRPIDVKIGPDGAIYIADWYNPIIQHGEVDFRDPRRDTEHGRIWRVTSKKQKAVKRPKYEQLSINELVALLGDPSITVKQFARNRLRSQDDDQVNAALEAWMAAANESQRDQRKLEAVWIRLAQQTVDAKLLDELRKSADARIRAAALRVIGERHGELPNALAWLGDAASDQDDQVVLEAVCGLHNIGSLPAVQAVLLAAAKPKQDPNLTFAIWNALRSTEPIWLAALRESKLSAIDEPASLAALADAAKSPDLAGLLLNSLKAGRNSDRLIDLIAQRADPATLAKLVQRLVQDQQSSDALRRVVDICRSRNVQPENPSQLLTEPMQAVANDTTKSGLAYAAGVWKVESAIPILKTWIDNAGSKAELASVAESSVAALASIGKPEGQQLVRQLATQPNSNNPNLQSVAIAALSSFDNVAAAELSLKLFSGQSEPTPGSTQAVAAILGRKNGVEAMKKSLLASNKEQWQPEQARALLAAIRSSLQAPDDLVTTLLSATGLENAGWKWSDELAAKLIELSRSSGDAARGEIIYRQARLQCVRCHAIGESGVNIGPNLVSVGGSSQPDYLLQSLIDPAAKVKEGFQTLSVLTDDGEVISGLQKAKTDEQLQLLLADGTTKTLALSAIEQIKEGKSLMPVGLVDQLSQAELADLLQFLSQLGRTPDYTVKTEPWIRNWQSLVWTQPAHHLLNRNSLDIAATELPELTWQLLATKVNGTAPLSEASVFQPHQWTPKTVFLRCDLNVKQAGEVKLQFTQPIETVSIWIDGRPRPTPKSEEVIALTAGRHRLVVGIQTEKTDGQIGVKVFPAEKSSAVVETQLP